VDHNHPLVLLVDGSEEARDVACALEQEGYEVARAASTIEAEGFYVSSRLEAIVVGEEQGALAFNLRKGRGMDLKLAIRLDTGENGATIAERLQRDLRDWAGNQYVQVAGIDEHLKAINVERAGPEITASAHWNESQVNALAGLAVDSIDEIKRSGDPEKALRQQFGMDLAEQTPETAPVQKPATARPSGGMVAAE